MLITNRILRYLTNNLYNKNNMINNINEVNGSKYLIDDYIDFINNDLQKSKTILTVNLTFNNIFKTSVDQAMKDAKHFKNILDHTLYGKYKGKLRDRTKGCLIVEGDSYNPIAEKTHIHGVLGFDLTSLRKCKQHIETHWAKLKRAGFVREIKEWDGDDAWISYILKQSSKNRVYSDLIVM